ncbi:MAG: hypothetical protein K0U41_06490 [Gammaproteobacteria bacterium]|nr:hypothetical protein [Gammaproteobacteria bacterium]
MLVYGQGADVSVQSHFLKPVNGQIDTLIPQGFQEIFIPRDTAYHGFSYGIRSLMSKDNLGINNKSMAYYSGIINDNIGSPLLSKETSVTYNGELSIIHNSNLLFGSKHTYITVPIEVNINLFTNEILSLFNLNPEDELSYGRIYNWGRIKGKFQNNQTFTGNIGFSYLHNPPEWKANDGFNYLVSTVLGTIGQNGLIGVYQNKRLAGGFVAIPQ